MAGRYKIQIEYVNPTKIESEVPEEQKIREVDDSDEKSPENDEKPPENDEKPPENYELSPQNDEAAQDDSTFVPVITVTKQEAVLTKGDLKLQRVSVSENIAENKNKQNGGPEKHINPLYSAVHGEVLRTTQPMRHDKSHGEERKTRTKIPTLKFKQTVEKVRQAKRDSAEKTKHETPPTQATQIRRSSIPRLNKGGKIPPPPIKKETTVKKDSTKKNDIAVRNDTTIKSDTNIKKGSTDKNDTAIKNDATIKSDTNGKNNTNETMNIADTQAEDEFDKIYEETIDNKDRDIVVVENLLIDNIDDPDILETSFEEIIHAYDDNRSSKIPFVKQKSLHDFESPRRVKRRSSLRNETFDSKVTVLNTEAKEKNDELNTINNNTNQEIDNVSNIIDTQTFINVEDEASATDEISELSENQTKIIFEPFKVIRETVKVATPTFENVDCITKEVEHNIIEIKNGIEEKPVNNIFSTDIPNSSMMVKNIRSNEVMLEVEGVPSEYENTSNIYDKSDEENATSSYELRKETLEKEKYGEIKKEIPVPRGKVSQIINKIDSKDQVTAEKTKVGNDSELPKKKPIVSKIAVFTGDKVPKNEKDIQLSNIKPLIKLQYDGKEGNLIEKQTKEPAYFTQLNSDQINLPIAETKKSQHNKNVLETESVTNSTHATERSPKIHIKNNVDEINAATTPNETENKSTEHVNTIPSTEKEINNNFPEDPETHKDKNNKISLDIETHFLKEDPNLYTNNETIKDDNDRDFNKEIPTLKGKVSRIISRIYSYDGTISEKPKKDILVEIPKKKSVTSRIAIFERQKSIEVTSKTKATQDDSKLPKLRVIDSKRELETRHKPKIIHEVLKPQPLPVEIDSSRKIPKVDYSTNVFSEPTNETKDDNEETKENEILLTEDIVIYPKIEEIQNPFDELDKRISKDQTDTLDKTNKDIKIYDNLSDSKFIKNEFDDITSDSAENRNNVMLIEQKELSCTSSKDHELKAPENAIRNKFHSPDDTIEYRKEFTAIESKHLHKEEDHEVFVNRTNEITKIEDRLKRMKSRNEEFNMRRTKSVAELDLGDAVKGKVHNMIVRINSMEKIDVEKKEINIKERPRKRSVSEKIALFEKKLVPIKMDDSKETIKIDVKAKVTTENIISEEEYQDRITELTNAKLKYGRMGNMMYLRLRNGVDMPVLALGTALLDARLVRPVVAAAIDLGYRAIDTAYIYGNERAVGDALRAKIDDGSVTREEMFIVSKLWSTFHKRELVEQACRASLAAMGLEYFDLYLIHNPMSFKEGGDAIPKIANVLQFSESDYLDAWFGMEELVTKGLARSIGVSNFNSVQVARVVERGRVKPAVNQVECHPYLSQQRLDEFCSERDVKLSCFGVLGSRGTPAELRSSLAAAIDDPLVKVMAAGLHITPAQLLVRYQIECGHSVVVKASVGAHLWDNLQALSFALTPAQVDALHALNRNKRTYAFKGMGDTHRNYPFKIAF